jgi:hypothetical protein
MKTEAATPALTRNAISSTSAPIPTALFTFSMNNELSAHLPFV